MVGNLIETINHKAFILGWDKLHLLEGRIRIFKQSIDYKLWLMIKNGSTIPKKLVDGKEVDKLEEKLNDQDMKQMEQDAKAKHILYYAVNPNNFGIISICHTAKQI